MMSSPTRSNLVVGDDRFTEKLKKKSLKKELTHLLLLFIEKLEGNHMRMIEEHIQHTHNHNHPTRRRFNALVLYSEERGVFGVKFL
jgi:hypothetical protein